MISGLTLFVVASIATVSAFVSAAEASPLSQQRVRSTLGFSFLPPPGRDWTEEFMGCQIYYTKKTDPKKVSFYAIAGDCKLDAPLNGKEDLVEFVRQKKNQWGTDGRFRVISTSFVHDAANASCVRYRMDVKDSGANNKGDHPYLLLKIAGKFCTHRRNPSSVVDLAYSIRHVPGYDDTAYSAEGNAFLDSLRFEAPINQPAAGR